MSLPWSFPNGSIVHPSVRFLTGARFAGMVSTKWELLCKRRGKEELYSLTETLVSSQGRTKNFLINFVSEATDRTRGVSSLYSRKSCSLLGVLCIKMPSWFLSSVLKKKPYNFFFLKIYSFILYMSTL